MILKNDDFVTNADGILTTEDGRAFSNFVDGFVAQEVNFPEATVILLRLFEIETSAPGQIVSAAKANQVRMSPQSARKLGEILLRSADQAQGVGEPKQ